MAGSAGSLSNWALAPAGKSWPGPSSGGASQGSGQRALAWGRESLRDFSCLPFSRGSGRVGREESIHGSLASLSQFNSKQVKTPGW